MNGVSLAEPEPETGQNGIDGITLIARTETDPAREIYVLVADLNKVRIGGALAQEACYGRETVSSMAERKEAVAAINADFAGARGTWDGVPENICVLDGKIYTAPKYRTAIGFPREGKPRIGLWLPFQRWSWPSMVRFGDASHEIVLMNKDINPGWITLFTRDFQPSGESLGNETFQDGVEVFLDEADTVREIRANQPPKEIPPGWRVLVGRTTAADWLVAQATPGHKAEIRLVTEPAWQEYATILGGGPRILQDGEYVADPKAPFPEGEDFSVSGYKVPYYDTLQPRSGAGISRDGERLILAVVDGRQADSVGMTLEEFAGLLKEHGAWDALQFDSGGSATLFYDGEVLNDPSDGRERPISNALLVFSRKRAQRASLQTTLRVAP